MNEILKFKLDLIVSNNINDKLFNEVNIMYNIQDNNDKWITLENDKKFRFYIKNINNEVQQSEEHNK